MRKVISKLLNRGGNGNEIPDLAHLTQLVRRYSVERQQVPKDLKDLVASNYLEVMPVPPAGQRFVIDRKAVEVRLE